MPQNVCSIGKCILRGLKNKRNIQTVLIIDNLDEVIELIRSSRTPEDARNGLIDKFKLSEMQAKAILDLRLQKLTGLEMGKIKEEHSEIMIKIQKLNLQTFANPTSLFSS